MSSHETADLAIREIEVLAPRVRSDLRWTFQEIGGEKGYLVEDLLSGRFFRLGERETRFVKALDGRRNLSQIVAQMSREQGAGHLEPAEAVSLVRSLADAGLVTLDDGEHAHRLFDELNDGQEAKRSLAKAGQLLFLKVPLGNPDRFFSFLARKLGWLASPAFFLVWLVIVGAGLSAIAGQWPRFRQEFTGVFDVDHLWLTGLLWVALKAFHECWHGMVCRKFGGAVPEAGVTLLLLVTPLGYVNASSSTAFPSKWQRIAVSAAGIYGEVLLAGLAALAWAGTQPGPWSSALHQLIVLSSLTTVVFNANPLMRFDGYYILSDLLEIPNLYSKGQRMFAWLVKRWIFGIRKASFPLRENERAGIIALYGVAAAIWRVLVIVGLLVAAAYLFHGIGLILAVIAGLALVLQFIGGIVKYLKESAAGEGIRPIGFALRLSVMVLAMASVLFFVRVEKSVRAPAVVRTAEGGEIRVECPGFLTEIPVADGQAVREGELLARLENPEEVARLRQLELELESSRIRHDQFLSHEQLASWQAEKRNLGALEEHVRELAEFTATLEIRAPRDGTVQARQLDSLVGNWIQPGTFLMVVSNPAEKELLIMAPQEEVAVFREAIESERSLTFRALGRWGQFPAVLDSVTPRATLQPAHFALIAPGGGPLTARRKPGAGAGDSSSEIPFELVEPHIEARANFSVESGVGQLRDGETGFVAMGSQDNPRLADVLWREMRDRFQNRVSP